MRSPYITYNGVTLGLVKTNRFTCEPILTDDGIDYLWTKFRIDINCVFAPFETAYAANSEGLPVSAPTAIPPTTHAAVRFALSQPRGTLIFLNCGFPLLTSPDSNLVTVTDANNGPFTQVLDVFQVAGAQTFLVHFVIETYLTECPNDVSVSPLISNRFSQSQIINRELYTEITTRGTAYFRIDLLQDAGVTADSFRDTVLPQPPPGCQRQSIDVRINSAANMLYYECRDVEKPYDLGETGVDENGDPVGAGPFAGTCLTNLEGYFTTQTLSAQPDQEIKAGTTIANITLKLWGNRQASNWNLTQLAFLIMNNSGKFPFGIADGRTIYHISINQALHERYVEVNCSARIPPIQVGPQPFGPINVDQLRQDLITPSQGGVNPQPLGGRGTATYDLLASAIGEACAEQFGPQPMQAVGTGEMVPYSPGQTPVSVTPTDLIQEEETYDYSDDTLVNFYTRATISSRYTTQAGTMQLPLGSPLGSTSTPTPTPTPTPTGTSITPTSTVVTLSNPISQRIIEWKAERMDSVPNIPAPIVNDQNQVLLDYYIEPLSIQIMPDNAIVYSVKGLYIYAMLGDLSQMTQLAFDIPQWINIERDQQDDTILLNDTSGNFIHGLIDDPES